MLQRASMLVLFLLLVSAAAGIGSLFMPGPWYASLTKPALTPPNWVFGPVWTALYLLIAVAAWLVWDQRGWPGSAWPLSLWVAQLALNAAWSWLFFGLHRPGIAAFELLGLWAVIVATTVAFYCARPLAAWLFVPYLLWVSFAGWLNFGIWRLNP